MMSLIPFACKRHADLIYVRSCYRDLRLKLATAADREEWLAADGNEEISKKRREQYGEKPTFTYLPYYSFVSANQVASIDEYYVPKGWSSESYSVDITGLSDTDSPDLPICEVYRVGNTSPLYVIGTLDNVVSHCNRMTSLFQQAAGRIAVPPPGTIIK